MEEDRSDQLDKRRDKTDLEGESSKGQVETGKDERQRLPGWHRGERGLFRMDSRRTQDRYLNTVTRRRGLLLEQHIFHKEKDREVPSNPRLPCTQFRTERYSFQNGRPSHCGETDPKGRFRNLTRSISGLFPDPSSQGLHPIPSLQVRREILRVQRHALRIQRRTENFHESYEKSFARNPKKMEGQVHFLLGRCPIAGSRSSQAEDSNSRNCRVVSTIGLNHQQGEERVLPQEELQLSRMDVEYEPDGCLNGTTETQGTEERVYQMDEEGEEEQLCKDERLRFIHRSAQRRTVRVQRRLFIHEQNVPFTEQAGQERWLGRSVFLEQQHKKTIGLLDSKAQGELHQRTGGLLEARRHINDRCFPLGLRSNLGSWRREISLSQTVQQHHKAPNIQFQGAPCSFIGSQQFFITNHSQPCVQDPSPFRQHQCSVQHQQVGCGTQPPAVIEKDQGHMSVDEIDDDSNPHSRGEKHNCRRIVQVGGRRRLYDKESTSEGSGEGSRSDSRDRRFRKRRKQEEGDMVWSRKSVRSRWSHGRLDKEHNAHSPSNSVDSSESQESKSRESESNHPSSGMEESDMEQLTGRDDVSILRLEELESGFNPGSRPEENGCSTASRGIHGSNNQLVREVGEEWWWKSLRICGVPDRIISVTKESIAKSTWNQYTFGFAHFSREWEELKLGPFPKYFDEWSMDCANCLLSMRDKGGKYSCLCATRSAISLFSKTVYGKDLSKVSLISTIFRSFSFSQTHRKPYTKMWSPDIVLSYYENYGLNEYLSFFDLTVKCILLVMLFTSCRFHELEQISMANSIFENDAIYLSTRLKTSRSREYITVPCLEEVHKRICPARAIHTLWERVKATYENRDTFLLNTTHHTPLTAKGIRTLAKIGLRKAGVPDEYRPYTIKHASISKLASSGIPEVCIAKHARLSTTAHTPSRSYYKANLANRMARALLASEEDSSQQDESAVVEKSRISKQIEGIPFCATQQTTTIMFGLPPLQPLNHADSTAEPFSTQAPSPDLPSQQTFAATQPNQAIILPTSVEEPEDNNTAKRNGPDITRGEPETDRTDIRTEICKCKDLPNYEHSLNKEVL
ncbi:uncharacterized protein MONOS_705 [Monocercomonoides exilis]|uniref:uncharacterized protein n=1 Tax=Monocercomonoides exilis TaxID=2049356 RepID=UPI003559B1D9|nr:hypothetical protein MONOS_705 [Monocercomonoides exilis]|eukprot:MONOS_705.1-p1 / transcript=MONOS_705.1 / gene=MONOS_705 / organism=Monocercomonoides_exilis_PA203 / gene_product=unspecified product / transcript_product=unspecified product / location=Mono_scaffold00011:257824-261069(+) / protein_length=1081 / sequence_SO=supercontig / SO=protein_coding / is_pseudo=false